MTGAAGQAGITGASTSSVVEHSFGGALNQYQEVGVYATIEKGSMDNQGSGQSQDIPVMLAPFPELFSYDEQQQGPYNGWEDASPTVYADPTNKYHAGQIMNGGANNRFDSASSRGTGYYVAQPTGPFEGGKGTVVADGHEWSTGSRVSMGAGSGATRTTDSSGRCHSAKGGAGVVLIFPISMG